MRLRTFNSAHQPGSAKRDFGWLKQTPAHFSGRPVPFAVVTRQTTRHQVFPRILSTPGARKNMINRGGSVAAIGTAVSITPEHTAPGNRNVTVVRHLDIARQHNDRGSLPRPVHAANRMPSVTFNHDGPAIHDKNQSSPKGHHRQRFISRVEYQCPRRPEALRRFDHNDRTSHSTPPESAGPLTQKTPSKNDGVSRGRKLRHPRVGLEAHSIRKCARASR